MYLQKLEIQGFKSFAHKTVLEFNRQLTAVVGPNGSGKSNIADAVRWVLGEQSLKLLRGKRSEDVIFAGSDLKSRLGMAEVSMHLNNEDGSAPIDFSEVVITRRVFRDGQSEYLLNQSPVRLQDIQLMLARANFGQKTYSVIGQGMVDSILMSSPAERKEFFEEATGVKQYQLKREQSIAKLLATYENLEQAGALMNEIEPRLRSLTRQVKRLERREELEREVRELQKVYYRYRYHHLERKRSEATTVLSGLREHMASHQATAARLRARLKELERDMGGASQLRELEQQQRDLRLRVGALTKRQAYAQAQTEIAHLKRGQGELVLLQQRQDELAQEVRRYQERMATLTLEAKGVSARLAAKVEEQTKLGRELERSSGEGGSDWLERELTALAHEQADLRRHLVAAATLAEAKAVVTAVEHLEERLRGMVARLQRRGSNGEELTKLLSSLQRVASDVAAGQAEVAALERERTMLTGLLQRAQTALEELTGKLSHDGPNPVKGTAIAQELTKAEAELTKVEAELGQVRGLRDSRQGEAFDLQRELSGVAEEQRRLEQEAHEVELELARLETKLEDLEREMAQEAPPELVHSIKEPGEVGEVDEGATALELTKLKHQLELTGGIEPEVFTEYQQTKTRYDFLATQTDDLTAAAGSLESIIRDLDATIEKKFLAAFKAIDEKFVQYFKVLFGGGKVQLILQRETAPEETDETEAEEETTGAEGAGTHARESAKEKFLRAEKVRSSLFAGVEIRATPPGKKLSSITALSGGERALTSIALICSIISSNPSPFVVLDEVDAALDEANSERFAAILDSLMDSTQFITVTHNRATMRRAAILYGVTMGEDGVSKLLSVKFSEADELAAQDKPKPSRSSS